MTPNRIDEMIDEFHREHRDESRANLDSAAFLSRLRQRIGSAPARGAAGPRRPLAGWSIAAVIPLALALFLVFGPEGKPPAESLGLISDLEVLEILDGFPEEDLDELDADSLVQLLEDLEFLQSIDTELLETSG